MDTSPHFQQPPSPPKKHNNKTSFTRSSCRFISWTKGLHSWRITKVFREECPVSGNKNSGSSGHVMNLSTTVCVHSLNNCSWAKVFPPRTIEIEILEVALERPWAGSQVWSVACLLSLSKGTQLFLCPGYSHNHAAEKTNLCLLCGTMQHSQHGGSGWMLIGCIHDCGNHTQSIGLAFSPEHWKIYSHGLTYKMRRPFNEVHIRSRS